jgi:hypothetical protein
MSRYYMTAPTAEKFRKALAANGLQRWKLEADSWKLELIAGADSWKLMAGS